MSKKMAEDSPPFSPTSGVDEHCFVNKYYLHCLCKNGEAVLLENVSQITETIVTSGPTAMSEVIRVFSLDISGRDLGRFSQL